MEKEQLSKIINHRSFSEDTSILDFLTSYYNCEDQKATKILTTMWMKVLQEDRDAVYRDCRLLSNAICVRYHSKNDDLKYRFGTMFYLNSEWIKAIVDID
jgi:hypothetical protein